MRLEAKKDLEDVRRAAVLIAEFVDGKVLDDYRGSALLRSAVERQLAIVGEGLRRLAGHDPSAGSGIRELRRIIGFRNLLVHGYDVVDDLIVWDIVQSWLPGLREDVERMLNA